MPHVRLLTVLGNRLTSVQSVISLERWKGYTQFEDDKGLGRVALLSCILATILGVNLVFCSQLVLIHLGLLSREIFGGWSDGTLQMALQWTVYAIALCAFHLGEFFTTAVFNPSVTSADSFMVNHSKAYTAAALVSWLEFCIRIFFFPDRNSPRIFCMGIIFVLGGQITRSWAMTTCGESFNHYIQRDKKENHVLVTSGIYGILRHPSYFGFFYWAVGTQLLLCNPLSTILYGIAAWTFFRYRIAYEEETLSQLFPNGAYESYAARTCIGIPFISLALKFNERDQ
mmetsp:Transcript_12290/g.30046  ORF Transcript_12290/g.30046 Transcript_12290/m.30046 type:complete len:285 (-) Transcript_12290:651-1505(-)